MTDITTLAPLALTALTPYLPILANAAAEEIGKSVPEAVKTLWASITKKFETKPAAQEAAADLLKNPKDEDTQASFRKELKKACEDDPAFIAELAKLLEAAGVTTTYTATLTGDGAIAQGPNAKAVGKGGIMVGRDVGGNLVVGNHNKIND